MKIISVNVGSIRKVKWRGSMISTGIYKEPVDHHVTIGRLNVEGDVQADPRVHGGADKALYAYAAEHYPAWKNELDGKELPWGMFGENLTINGGLFEDEICVGDCFAIGEAEVVAVQPRLPCFKLGIRFGTQTIVKKFARSGRYGIYFRVLKEGIVSVHNRAERIFKSTSQLSIGDLGRLLVGLSDDRTLIERAAALEILPDRVRLHFQSVLKKSE